MIVLSEVRKSFAAAGRTVNVLEDISLSIGRGDFVSIVGPSGCGKTTLLRIIAGTIPAGGGTLSINGRPASGPSPDVGVVFQAPVLFPWRTVLENVLVPADVRGIARHELQDRAMSLLATAGLAGFEHDYPWRLSGGMQQRAAICRALLYDPPALLMDEPFGALDAMTREIMNAELIRMCAQTNPAVLLITHSIPEAVFLSDRVAVMSGRPGRIVASIEIDLPKPRSLDVMGSPRFAALTQLVRATLVEHHGLLAS
jgi:NitT/TauT family transport system ATP-binding protein